MLREQEGLAASTLTSLGVSLYPWRGRKLWTCSDKAAATQEMDCNAALDFRSFNSHEAENMRLPWVRFTVRRMMVGVALMAVCVLVRFGLHPGGVSIESRLSIMRPSREAESRVVSVLGIQAKVRLFSRLRDGSSVVGDGLRACRLACPPRGEVPTDSGLSRLQGLTALKELTFRPLAIIDGQESNVSGAGLRYTRGDEDQRLPRRTGAPAPTRRPAIPRRVLGRRGRRVPRDLAPVGLALARLLP